MFGHIYVFWIPDDRPLLSSYNCGQVESVSKNKMRYQPISCSYHDELEAIATLRKEVLIQYKDQEGHVRELTARIRTFQTRAGEEFMILNCGHEIRLDRIISVDGKLLSGYC